jgi:hypothetical protein
LNDPLQPLSDRRSAADETATMLRMGRKALAGIISAVVLVPGAAAIAGCGSSNNGTSKADPVARAADVTARVPGYRIAATATVTTPASGQLQIAMNGFFDRPNRSGKLTASETVAGHKFKFTEVFSGLTFYMDAGALPQLQRLTKGKNWIKFDMSRMLGAMGLGSLPTGTDPTQFLDFLRAVGASTQKVGTEQVRGVKTTHYRAKVDLDKYPKLLPPSQRAAAQRSVSTLVSALGSHSMPMDAWVDNSNLVRRIGITFNECVAQQHVRFGMRMDVFDYGPQAQPKLPGPSQAYDITPLLSSTLSKIKFGCSSS